MQLLPNRYDRNHYIPEIAPCQTDGVSASSGRAPAFSVTYPATPVIPIRSRTGAPWRSCGGEGSHSGCFGDASLRSASFGMTRSFGADLVAVPEVCEAPRPIAFGIRNRVSPFQDMRLGLRRGAACASRSTWHDQRNSVSPPQEAFAASRLPNALALLRPWKGTIPRS